MSHYFNGYCNCNIVSHVTCVISSGNRISDWHDCQLADQHRCIFHHCILLQLEVDSGHYVLPATHWAFWRVSSQNDDRI